MPPYIKDTREWISSIRLYKNEISKLNKNKSRAQWTTSLSWATIDIMQSDIMSHILII